MSPDSRKRIVIGLGAAVWLCATLHVAARGFPSEDYAELFGRVQLEHLYPDSKTFADAEPLQPIEKVVAEYRAASRRSDFDLRAFVDRHFRVSVEAAPSDPAASGQDVRAHIDRLWTVLERGPEAPSERSTRLPLPYRYVVPGGRFSEIYYWDSYFTMLGLEESGRHDLTVSMVKDFASLLDRFGFIPNGTRSYYLSRSQPPFFALMVELVAAREGEQSLATYLPQLRREYAFWMDGETALEASSAQRRLVRLPDRSLLNRYWDDRAAPRDEAYREDVATARASQRPAETVYRELRAAAESGWDFSSRWFADGKTLATIHTTDLVPPDLNSLLYQLEVTITRGCAVVADRACADQMQLRSEARKRAMTRHLWNGTLGAFVDYDWRKSRKADQPSAATLYPLFVRLSTAAQARAVASTLRSKLLQPGGLATTRVRTGQQWDAPNGWAPLQWIAIQGLRNYGETELAAQLAQRWIHTNLSVYNRTGKLVEKYDLRAAAEGGGGEYALQDGFGWTNGVLRKLLTLYPQFGPP